MRRRVNWETLDKKCTDIGCRASEPYRRSHEPQPSLRVITRLATDSDRQRTANRRRIHYWNTNTRLRQTPMFWRWLWAEPSKIPGLYSRARDSKAYNTEVLYSRRRRKQPSKAGVRDRSIGLQQSLLPGVDSIGQQIYVWFVSHMTR